MDALIVNIKSLELEVSGVWCPMYDNTLVPTDESLNKVQLQAYNGHELS